MEDKPQFECWENEYRNPKLMTLGDRPQNDVLRFLKWLKKSKKVEVSALTILDLGCGTGRNTNYLASLGNKVHGIDISKTAIRLARERAVGQNLATEYSVASIGERLNINANSIDLLLDVTSSNSLSEKERQIYLEESSRVLKNGGYFFVRALCKDGDKNAKNLLTMSPGKEYDTYIMKDLGLVERVFSESDFKSMYSPFYKIEKLIRKSGYAKLNGQSYKRNYLIAYLQK